MRRTPPGPPAGPLGHLRDMRRDVLGLLLRSAQEYGDVVRLRLGPWHFFLVNHPELIKQVCQDRHPRYDKATRTGSIMRSLAGDSVLTLSGPAWLMRRRLIQPFLSKRSVETYRDLILDLTHRALDRWVPGETVEVASEMTRLTCRIIARAMFSAELEAEAELVERAVDTALDAIYARIESLLDFSALLPSRSFHQAISELDGLVYSLVEERRSGASAPQDLLSSLLSARDPETGKGLSDRELRDEM
ncbi:MAG: cytochrome P450, partial [Candidatus Eremiobacterota bacterium]